MTTRSERVATRDGQLDAHVAIPAAGGGPGMLLLQEIFGVNDYVKDAARRLAELGYVVLAPDLYWRTQPGLALGHSEPEVGQAFAAMQQLDVELAVQDSIAALAALRGLPEVAGGRAGVLGFCLGGTLSFQVAVHGDPDTAVAYYGSGIPAGLAGSEAIACPLLLHYGGADPYIPREQVEDAAAAAGAREDFECHVHEDAGHAFDNSFAPMFSQPEAAARAWELTSAFLARTLPT